MLHLQNTAILFQSSEITIYLPQLLTDMVHESAPDCCWQLRSLSKSTVPEIQVSDAFYLVNRCTLYRAREEKDAEHFSFLRSEEITKFITFYL